MCMADNNRHYAYVDTTSNVWPASNDRIQWNKKYYVG